MFLSRPDPPSPYLVSFVCLVVLLLSSSIPNVSVSAATVSASTLTGWIDRLLDPCIYNSQAINDLRLALTTSLVGQELAINTTLDAIEQHIHNIDESPKALVLSLHGMT